MKPTLRVLLSALALASLVSCTSLPVAGPTPEKYLAVYFEPSASDSGVTHAIETWNTPAPFRLRAGLNYIPVPADVTEEMLTDFFADLSSSGRTFRLMTKSVYQKVSLPEGGTIVLVPLILSSKNVPGSSRIALITPMPQAKVQAILEDWKKDKNAVGWPHLVVAELVAK